MRNGLCHSVYDKSLFIFKPHDKINLDNFEENEKKGIDFFLTGIKLFQDSYYDHALNLFELASKLLKKEGDNLHESSCYTNIGTIHVKSGNYLSAIEFFNRSLNIKFQIKNKTGFEDLIGERGCYVSIAECYNKLRKHKEARKYYRNALKIDVEVPDFESAADMYFRIGIEHYEDAEYENAIVAFNDALRIAEEYGKPKDFECDCRNQLASAYFHLGKLDDAQKTFESALKFAEELYDDKRKSDIYERLALYYHKIGEFNIALENLNSALKIKENTDNKGQASCYYNIGKVYANIGNNDEAIKNIQKALKLANEANEPIIESDCYNSLGIISLNKGDIMDARKNIDISLAIKQKNNDKAGQSYTLNSLSRIFEEVGDHAKALEYLHDALRFAQDVQDKRGQCLAYVNMGQPYIESGRLTDAIEVLKKGLNLCEEINDQDLKRIATLDLGICYLESQPKIAYAYFKQSIEITESQGHKIMKEDKTDFYALKPALYAYQYIIPLCIRLQKTEEAFDYVERSKSTALFDLLSTISPKPSHKNIKDEDSKNEFIQQTNLRPSLNKIQEVISRRKNTALVEYFMAPDKIYIFVLAANKLHLKEVDISAKKVLDYLGDFETDMANYPDRGFTDNNWLDLSEYLIQPITEYLSTVDFVFFIPHYILHYIPLHTLKLNNQPLIQSHIIVYFPTASLIPLYEKKGTGSVKRCLSFGVAFEEEAKEIAKIFDTLPYTDLSKKETIEILKNNNTDIIHFSCHGHFNYIDPMASAIILYDGVLTAREIFSLKLTCELLTVSACETGFNQPKPGDELIGLTRALLYAGAGSVIVSMWKVDAKSTQQLMIEFYRLIKEGKDKATALRESQIRLISNQGYNNPYYWAPFILIGNWK